MFKSWSLIKDGAGDTEIEQLRQAVADWQAHGNELAFPVFRGVLTDAYRTVGVVEKGLAIVEEAMVKIVQTEERQEEARLHWLKGELLLNQSDPDEQNAEALLEDLS